MDALAADEAAARLRSRAGVLPALVVALDDWAHCRRGVGDEAGGKALTGLAQALDADPWRRRVREALAAKSEKALEELAGSAEVARQAPSTVVLLARNLIGSGKPERASEVLGRALREHPEDFWLHFYAAQASSSSRPRRDDEAVRHYTAALALRPRSVAVLINLGVALEDQGKLEEAIDCWRKAIELDPKLAMPHHNLGYVLRDQGKLDEAIACCRKAIELNPKYAQAQNLLGIALIDQGKLEEAVACFRKAIELNPKYAQPQDNLGLALKDQGKLEEAVACWRKAIEVDPKYVSAHINVGVALAAQGKLEEAIACWRKAIALNPTDARFQSGLAWFLATTADSNLRNASEAVTYARKAVELDPKSANHRNNLGVALYRAGDWQAAVESLEKADSMIEKGDRVHRMFLAMAHWQLGNKEKARQAYAQGAAWIAVHRKNSDEQNRFRAEAEELMEITPEDRERLVEQYLTRRIESQPDVPEHWIERAAYRESKAAFREAIEDYDQVIKLRPDDAEAWRRRAVACMHAGQFEQAAQDATRAIELAPTAALSYAERAWAYNSLGRFQEAVADCDNAIRLDGKIYWGYQRRSHARRMLGDHEGAVADAKRAIAINPNLLWAYQERAAAHAALKQWERAIGDYSEAIRLAPGRADCYAGRAEALLGLGRYDEALADCNQSVESQPQNSTAALIRAQMLVAAGRSVEYREACRQMLDRIGQSKDGLEVYAAARACALASEATSEPARIVELARNSVAAYPTSPWALHCLGMAHFRAGQLDEAAKRFHESLTTDPNWGARYLNWLSLALVNGERDETQAAREWLAKAVELMQRNPSPALQDRLEAQLLRREVEQLLGKSKEQKHGAGSKQEAPVAKPKPTDTKAAVSEPSDAEPKSIAKPKAKQE